MTAPADPFNKYLQKHGHYPRATLPLGGGKFIEVSLTSGYAVIRTYPPSHTTYVPRNQLVKLLQWAVPLVRKMDQSFSVEAAMTDYLQQEADHHRELRELKRSLYGRRRQSRMRRRRRSAH